ncbi:Tripartite ATP-independent periplasmic transporter, DctQ component [Pseudovibrio axinellae]|uniref:TRAP transporter small permease protein n=1 Tax=Pseudovibrio axinellae TaxID=989403 RepID=A0A166BBZ7_9HYPH|nr:TRAP transporter small permease subunit [Pseudovibrio axinellae]KZL22110.1 Tripartite ATP-independent periplasmic transporter, DctQ component [Pseudovibrio axinellae]SEQ54893.1 TRAP-type mannitol/chloroaromatic compound transport system, small permease component [Pseudovibrio axinellae]
MTSIISKLDAINRIVGHTICWFALIMLLLQFAIVLLRYLFGISYIFLGEGVLYMHAAIFMLGAGYTLLTDKHVRVDIFYGQASQKTKAVINIIGAVCFLLPTVGLLLWVSWPFVSNSWKILEGPISVGGIPASFLLKSLIPAFCILLITQGVSGILRDILFLTGVPVEEPKL